MRKSKKFGNLYAQVQSDESFHLLGEWAISKTCFIISTKHFKLYWENYFIQKILIKIWFLNSTEIIIFSSTGFNLTPSVHGNPSHQKFLWSFHILSVIIANAENYSSTKKLCYTFTLNRRFLSIRRNFYFLEPFFS